MAYVQGLEHLVHAVQELSLARDIDAIADIVRRTARQLTGADGATFVLRDGDKCYYKDEDAIEPLWKGQRFPLAACISGWAMLNRQATVIEDIYQDARIPHDAYRPTFVRSLVMVPIRTLQPIGAIGNYWAKTYRASDEEVHLLSALADSASVAMENVQVYQELEQRVEQRTSELAATNQRLQEEILERQRAEDAVRRLSEADELTGLLNRRGFFALARHQLVGAHRRGVESTLLFIDLDGLKHCNDSEGHAAGDAMLETAADVLRAVFRSSDIIARLGGDEFVVLAEDHGRTEMLLARLHEAARHPRRLGARPVAFSVGTVAVPKEAAPDLDQLIARADAAMYVDKQQRRARVA